MDADKLLGLEYGFLMGTAWEARLSAASLFGEAAPRSLGDTQCRFAGGTGVSNRSKATLAGVATGSPHMRNVCQGFKEAQVKILDYTALQAEALADQVHAPHPDKARSDAFQRISETAKKGHYNAYITVRGVDLRQLCLDLLNRGFDIESYGTPDRDDCYSVNVTWGNASSRHIIHRLAMYAKSHYFAHNNWPTCLWLRQDEYDLAMAHYKEPEVTEHILGAPVSFRIHVDNSLYKT